MRGFGGPARDRSTRGIGRQLRILGAAVLVIASGCGDGGDASGPGDTPTGGGAEPAAREASTGATDPAIRAIDEFIAAQNIDKSDSSWKTSLPKPPELDFSPDATYYWDLDTNVGPISIRYMPDQAPMHVSSSIYLTRLGFFDGLTFHRVIAGFMAQGGDPLGNGRGSPGYRFDGEFGGSARHDRPGILSQANAGPGTDGSQFFITFVPTPHLDGKHTIFGEVESGMETVKQLEAWRQRGSAHINDELRIDKAEVRVE